MTTDHVELAKAGVAALNGGDLRGVVANAWPDFEYDFSRSIGPQRGVYTLEGMNEISTEFESMWESSRYEVDEYIEAGDQIVAPFTSYYTGRDGVEVVARAAWLISYREGRLARICFYQSKREALEAVGLGEPGADDAS